MDGVQFDKPAVGVVKGNTTTNVLGPNRGGPGVFLNTKPGAPASQRFVSLGKCHDSSVCKGPLAWVTSPDGITWPDLSNPASCAVDRAVDTQMSTFWDPSFGAFVSYTRDRWVCHPIACQQKQCKFIRCISIMEICLMKYMYKCACASAHLFFAESSLEGMCACWRL